MNFIECGVFCCWVSRQLDEGVCGSLQEGDSSQLLGKTSMKLQSGVQPSKQDQKGAKLDS